MTKQTYFEMCEMLGQEPIEDEIPTDFEDFPLLVQQALLIYGYLEDRWDSMGGGFLGKNYSIIFNFFELYHIEPEEALLVLEFLQHVDSVRSKIISEKIKSSSPATK